MVRASHGNALLRDVFQTRRNRGRGGVCDRVRRGLRLAVPRDLDRGGAIGTAALISLSRVGGRADQPHDLAKESGTGETGEVGSMNLEGKG